MKKKLLSALLVLILTLAIVSSAMASGSEGPVTMTQSGGTESSYESIMEAIAATGEYQSTNRGQYVITLNEDRTEDVVIPANRSIKIDLNGHRLTNVAGHTITNNSTRTYITDTSLEKTGTVDSILHGKGAVYNNINANITLQGGTYTRSLEASTSDENSGGNSWYVLKNFGTMSIQNGVTVKFSDENPGVYSSLIGNGWQSWSQAEAGTNGEPKPSQGGNKATLTIRGGNFTGGQITVKNDDYGVLTIHGGVFTQPSEDRYAVLNNNEAAISGGTFQSQGATVGSLHYDGGANTGGLTISNGSFTSATGNAVYMGSGADLALTGGTFIVEKEDTYGIGLAEGATAEISGGEFPGMKPNLVVNDSNAFKAGYGPTENADGSVSVGVTDGAAVAVVTAQDGTKTNYLSLGTAMSNAPAGSVIQLKKDVTLTASVGTKNYGVTLDLNGHNIDGTAVTKDSAVELKTTYGAKPVAGIDSTMRLINRVPGEGGRITAPQPLCFRSGNSDIPLAGEIREGVTLTGMAPNTSAVTLESSAYLLYSDTTAKYVTNGGFRVTASDGSRIYGNYANAVGASVNGLVTLLHSYVGSDSIHSGNHIGTLDLGGNTYTYTGTGCIVDINYDNAGITVQNGSLMATDAPAHGIEMLYSNSSLTLDQVTVTVPGKTYGIVTNGLEQKNTVSLQESTLNVENGYGIYFPSTGTVSVENSVINAKYVGVQMCAGTLNVTGERTSITVTDKESEKTENDGVIGDGAAISIVERDGYQDLGSVEIDGGVFKASNRSAAVKAYTFNNTDKTEEPWPTANEVIAITGGTFQVVNGDQTEQSDVTNYIPAGILLTQDETGAVIKDTAPVVATINDLQFTSLKAAIDYASAGDTIRIVSTDLQTLEDEIVSGVTLVVPGTAMLTIPQTSIGALADSEGKICVEAGGQLLIDTDKIIGGTGSDADLLLTKGKIEISKTGSLLEGDFALGFAFVEATAEIPKDHRWTMVLGVTSERTVPIHATLDFRIACSLSPAPAMVRRRTASGWRRERFWRTTARFPYKA